MNVVQKCVTKGCREDGVALVREGVLLCGRCALRWVKREYEAATEAA